jgi:hypothetical protein
MKTLLLLLVVGISANAQFRLNDEQTSTLNLIVDPVASIKEEGIYFGAELTHNAHFLYIRTGLHFFPVLEDGYAEWNNALGLNFTSGYFNDTKYYIGFTGGLIKRNGVHPTGGFEAGIEQMLTESLFIGGRLSYVKRGDADFYDGEPWEHNGYLTIGIKL